MKIKDCFDKEGNLIHEKFLQWMEELKQESKESLRASKELEKQILLLSERIDNLSGSNLEYHESLSNRIKKLEKRG